MYGVEKTKENLRKCKCMSCPSYTNMCKLKNTPENLSKLMGNFSKTEHYEKMFCAFEKSNCIEQNNGCLCAECSIYKDYNLSAKDFCFKTGGVKDQHNV